MAKYPPHWVLVGLILAIVNPVTPQPVRTGQRDRTEGLANLEARRPPTQIETYHDNIHPKRSISEHLSKRDPSSDETIVSVLVPVAQTSDHLSHGHDHATADTPDIVSQRLNDYGEYFNDQENESYTASTLQISPNHYISFLSYRISFPFLKFAPKCLPRFPLPGIFTTVVLLLALVWIAILTIALVELGNYMWQKRRAARPAIESDNIASDALSGTCEDGKIQLGVLAVSGPERPESYGDNESLMSDFNSESGSDSEPDVDDYRIF
ncbi:uncharacterized protein N7496_011948 [Penicillium cataractarum]|uniref:Uncharacterized protein n=1 Tax=Penicillium cataractarum TaxID=2100454 RepID=A0A9W9RHA1_9EURO|nr:uncharacterized protein N7496_011948 [Penicillium cataractarum]KAJ5359535.1 hypothetical protein N7496_011948 [Penicillium cataractarum]